MKSFKKTRTAKAIAGITGLTAGLFMLAGPLTASALSEAQISSILGLLSSFGADSTVLTDVEGALRGTPTVGGGTGSTGGTCYNFTRSLFTGMDNPNGADVVALQDYLTGTGDFTYSGGSTGYFGSITGSAVASWQSSNGVTPPAGYFGPLSQAKYNSICGGTGTDTGTGTVTPPVSGTDQLTVSAGLQPANSLAPIGASRLPFTVFTVTAGSQSVTVNSVVVQRSGFGDNDNFDGVVLLDENGTQFGQSKTLNSLDQTTVGNDVTIPAGTSKTFTIAGNIQSTLATMAANAGQVFGLDVIAINASSPVVGALPITGAAHTANATLTVGTLTAQTSSLTDSDTTLDIGDTGHVFAGVRLTAGSAEDVLLKGIRFEQTGSASDNDINNVVVDVDGAMYPTVISGNYYNATFGAGINIPEGNSVEVIIKGDVVDGSNRTVIMDIRKRTDVIATGQTFGFGITPPAGSGTAAVATQALLAGTPWYDAITKTIQAGNVTTISKATAVPAQNIAVNVNDQPLGGFTVDLKSEPITVESMVFNFNATGSGGQVEDITLISLFDENGAVVAGPVDATGASAFGSVTFTDSVTIPTGMKTYTLKGKLGTDFSSGQTVIASTTPSSDWTNITGDVTGDSITLTNGLVTMNTMTVKPATTTVTFSASPSSQNVVMGVSGFVLGNVQFDATDSGEDVRVNSIAFNVNTPTGGSYPNNCLLVDNGTVLTNTALNPSSDGDKTFTLNTPLIVPKGTVKTAQIRCDVPTNLTANDSARWSLGSTANTATGVTSNATITLTETTGNGGTMTFKSAGSWTVAKDAASPAYAVAAGGTSGVTLGVLRITASDEAISITQIPLQLTNTHAATASSSAADITNVTLWDGITQVGTAVFAGSATTSIAYLNSGFMVPKDDDAKLTLKTDLSDIGTNKAGTEGHLIAVDYDGNAATADSKGVGADGGTSIPSTTTSDTATAGVRAFNSFPILAKDTQETTVLSDGDKSLLRFKVTADGTDDIGIYKFKFNVATTGVNATAFNVYGYTNSSYSTAISGVGDNSAKIRATDVASLGATTLEIVVTDSSGLTSVLEVPAGVTYYFDVRGTISGSSAGDSITTQLEGDTAYPSLATFMGTATAIDSDTNDSFIWSPLATSTATTTTDWTNGFGLDGLPSTNMTPSVMSL